MAKILEHNDITFHSLEDYQYRPDVETAQKYFTVDTTHGI